jgi:hypothetical protein
MRLEITVCNAMMSALAKPSKEYTCEESWTVENRTNELQFLAALGKQYNSATLVHMQVCHPVAVVYF